MDDVTAQHGLDPKVLRQGNKNRYHNTIYMYLILIARSLDEHCYSPVSFAAVIWGVTQCFSTNGGEMLCDVPDKRCGGG